MFGRYGLSSGTPGDDLYTNGDGLQRTAPGKLPFDGMCLGYLAPLMLLLRLSRCIGPAFLGPAAHGE